MKYKRNVERGVKLLGRWVNRVAVNIASESHVV